MIRVHRVEVTGTVSGETPVMIGDSVLNITSITVAYHRDQTGAWAADDTGIVVNGDITDSNYAGYTGPVFTANTAVGHPPWVVKFIDTARPTLGTETPA